MRLIGRERGLFEGSELESLGKELGNYLDKASNSTDDRDDKDSKTSSSFFFVAVTQPEAGAIARRIADHSLQREPSRQSNSSIVAKLLKARACRSETI
jgi:hypothetical protein